MKLQGTLRCASVLGELAIGVPGPPCGSRVLLIPHRPRSKPCITNCIRTASGRRRRIYAPLLRPEPRSRLPCKLGILGSGGSVMGDIFMP